MSISTHCVVYGCPNKGSSTTAFTSNSKEVRFYTFPRRDLSPVRFNKWMDNLNRDKFTPLQGSVVCSIHFTEDNFLWTPTMEMRARYMPPIRPQLKELLKTAVPTLYMGNPLKCISEKENRGVDNDKSGKPAKGKKFLDKGIQCEMGKETYRTQPGVTITCAIDEENDMYDSDSASNSSRPTTRQRRADDASYRATSSEPDTESDQNSSHNEDIEEIEDIEMRGAADVTEKCTGIADWCKCGCCSWMTADFESCCCREFTLKVKDNDAECITSHPSFKDVVLNIHTLNTARHALILATSETDVKCDTLKNNYTNRFWRHLAYKQYIHWTNSWTNLGKIQVKSIPACVLNVVRKEYPEEGNNYCELKPPKRGMEPDYFD